MRNNKRGSSIVLVVLITSVISLLVLSLLRTRTFQSDIAIQKQLHEYYFWATQGLLNYGISLIKLHSIEYGKEKPEITFAQWPMNSEYATNGRLRFITETKDIKLVAQLEKNNTSVCVLSCLIELLPSNNEQSAQIKISEWRQETIFQKNVF